jgi:hypothetical protein
MNAEQMDSRTHFKETLSFYSAHRIPSCIGLGLGVSTGHPLGTAAAAAMPGEPFDNTMLIVGAESATFYQRVPVPLGMWRPSSRISVPLRLNAPGVVALGHQRAAVLICYEQLLTFPILASMRQDSTVVVGISNSFLVHHTSIPLYQVNAMRSWGKLFRLPYLLAVNS